MSAFCATLGFSRASYVEFVTDMKVQTLVACHERAFAAFGGVPKRVLYDNMKTVVLERDSHGDGQHRYHAGFLDYAKHCGFVIKLCRPYRAKTKGKVERFNGYLRRSFYVPLTSRLKQLGLQLKWHAGCKTSPTHACTARLAFSPRLDWARSGHVCRRCPHHGAATWPRRVHLPPKGQTHRQNPRVQRSSRSTLHATFRPSTRWPYEQLLGHVKQGAVA